MSKKRERERERERREREQREQERRRRRAYQDDRYDDDRWDDEREILSSRSYTSGTDDARRTQSRYPETTRTKYAPKDSGSRRSDSYARSTRQEDRYPDERRRRNDDRRDDRYPKKKVRKGSIFVWIQLLISIAVFATLLLIDIIPLKYMAIVALIFILLFVMTFALCRIRAARNGGRVTAVIISVLLAVVLVYLIRTFSVLDQISGAVLQTDEMSVVVLADDPAESINDAADYVFGTASVDSDHAEEAVQIIESELGEEIATYEYTTYTEAATALLEGQTGAIILNEAYRDLVEDLYEDFSDETKVIYTTTLETEISFSFSSKNVTSEPFIVYISGIDVYGEISQTSRSDVNILAAVNPETHEIVLVTTPRDSYVELASYGAYDKLTHAGLYGVSESMATLENLYDIEIDYYARVNFTGFETIVDALGGITVYSDYAFTSTSGYSYVEGYNDLNGEEALAFARERKAFSNGDFQRGVNQMRVIEAILDKAMSPSILLNYTSILDAASGSFETSMSSSEISSLVKYQLSDGSDWSITSYEVTGTTDTRTTYSYGSSALSVVILDSSSVEEAKALIAEVMESDE